MLGLGLGVVEDCVIRARVVEEMCVGLGMVKERVC